MRFKNRFTVIPLVALLVTLVGTGYAQYRGSQKSVRNKKTVRAPGASIPVMTKDLGAAANILAANHVLPPTPWVNVDSSADLDGADKTHYEEMASLISGYTAVPPARTAYFSGYANNIGSWGGSVTNVQAQPQGGYLVTVNVGAILSDSWIPFSYYEEQYVVGTDNSVTYSKSLDPDGTAGQVLGIWLQ